MKKLIKAMLSMFSNKVETESSNVINRQVRVVPPKPKDTDKWLQLISKLPEKLEWAGSINIDEVAQKAGSTAETVMKVVYPDLWLELGEFVKVTERRSLKEAVILGGKILSVAGDQSEIWVWFHAYMNSSEGWGAISPKDYYRYAVGKKDLVILDRIINIGENVRRNLNALNTVSEYVDAVTCVPRQYLWEDMRSRSSDLVNQLDERKECFNKRKERLLEEGRAACKGLEELCKFYYSIPTCPSNSPWILCTCNARTNTSFEIYKIVEEALKSAKDASEVEAIEIPLGLHRSGQGDGENTRWLLETKESVLKKLQEVAIKEEEQRIRSLIKS